jgi:tetratricopeptide (TPR) repeat protein
VRRHRFGLRRCRIARSRRYYDKPLGFGSLFARRASTSGGRLQRRRNFVQSRMLDLPTVTLACIDCAQPALALAALGQTAERIRFADVLFASDEDPEAPGLTYLPCAAARSSAERLAVLLSVVAPRVATAHLLIVQWDAFVVNPDAWTADFLDYDLTAPADGLAAESIVDGIVLVSRRLLADGSAAAAAAAGIRRAPVRLAERFGFRGRPPVGRPFAFEGAFNLWMYLGPAQLDALFAMATPDILRSQPIAALAGHLRELGRIDEARSASAAIARAETGGPPAAWSSQGGLDVGSRSPASAPAASAAATARAVGRNDPCPCGSGRKYKQCHGQLGASIGSQAHPLAPETPLPGAPAVSLELARDAVARDDATAARTHLARVLAGNPDQAEALGLLGVLASRERRFDEAEKLLERALERTPDAPELHSNRGALAHARGRFTDAAASYRRAVALDAGHVAAYNNLGLALQELSDVDAAVAAFREAVRRAPSFADAHWNLGLALLLDGRYEEGFAEHEWRLSAASHRAWWERRQQFPRWGGEAIEGRRLVVLAEQGMGDMIHFARYATLLAARGAVVIVEAAPALAALLASVPGVAGIAPLGGPYPPCDLQIPMMSLPFAFATRVETIPVVERYVRVADERRAWANAALGPRTKARIGIAWAGNPQHVRDRFRSMPLSTLAPLLALEGVEWIALQKGEAARELASLPPSLGVRDCGGLAGTFADLAAIVDALDAVVTVDTALVHLAGALDKRAIVLIDAANDWRWMRSGERSAWYPSVRIARQQARGDWTAAIDAASRQLTETLSGE